VNIATQSLIIGVLKWHTCLYSVDTYGFHSLSLC